MGNFTCDKCHAEKTGPFLYPHDASAVDGCAACHRVHGSPNRHLLTHERQINLCYQCHPGTQMPGFHSPGAFVNKKCTACHAAIHGSNTHPSFRER
jgi:predicted CXXCH cytochrome family protein